MFIVKDPLGYDVRMSQSVYIDHILFESGHNEVKGSEICSCVSSPEYIYHSSQENNRLVYFAHSVTQYPKMYMKTITEIDDETNKQAHVVTSFITKKLDGGIITAEGGLLYESNEHKL